MMSGASVTEGVAEIDSPDVAALSLEGAVERIVLPGGRKNNRGLPHGSPDDGGHPVLVPASARLDVEALRRHAWEIGSRRSHANYVCPDSYVNVCAVSPGEAFLVWRLQPAWIEATAERKRGAWNGARLVIRLYDVSYIHFNGFNAHRMRDVGIDAASGERLVPLPLAGTTQLAEIGYLLRSGEFVPGARSTAVCFPSATVSANHDVAALYVDDRLRPEPVASPWEGASYLRERSKPRLRAGLRIAMLSFQAGPGATQDPIATFVGSVGSELLQLGMQVHGFVPRREGFEQPVEVSGVLYHPLDLGDVQGPIEAGLAYARCLEARLSGLPAFDCFHVQDWMTGLVPWLATRPAIVALSSLEATRRNGSAVGDLSLQIEKLEADVARAADCVIVPPGLRERILAMGLDDSRVHGFPMAGRPMDEWEVPFDAGRAKAEIGLAPSDRMLLFVGPLEWAAGPDLVVDALPTVVSRTAQARVVFVGCGPLRGELAERAHRIGVGHAVRLLGHVELPRLIPLLRAADALVLPSRQRVAHDHDVVGLARRAGRPVITTHGGPTQGVRHEHDGVLVYDNPPSLVWGMSRVLDDRRHADEMGRNGLRQGEGASWSGVARMYADLCALTFAELRDSGAHDGAREEGRPA